MRCGVFRKSHFMFIFHCGQGVCLLWRPRNLTRLANRIQKSALRKLMLFDRGKVFVGSYTCINENKILDSSEGNYEENRRP